MRQVPEYLIVGNGRMARHFCHYLRLLNIPFDQWSRGDSASSLESFLDAPRRVLLLISDDAIESFIEQHISSKNQHLLIHFSGRLSTSQAWGAHPLMTFSESLYELSIYQRIAWVVDRGAPDFDKLLPGLSNAHHQIDPDQKALYHAWCVLAGNGSVVLWQKLREQFASEFGFAKEVIDPYLKQIFTNMLEAPEGALTGPWVRNDQTTIALHRKVLKGEETLDAYNGIFKLIQKRD